MRVSGVFCLLEDWKKGKTVLIKDRTYRGIFFCEFGKKCTGDKSRLERNMFFFAEGVLGRVKGYYALLFVTHCEVLRSADINRPEIVTHVPSENITMLGFQEEPNKEVRGAVQKVLTESEKKKILGDAYGAITDKEVRRLWYKNRESKKKE